MANAKYELTNEILEFAGISLHRIRALRDIGEVVKAGDLGGYVQSEANLAIIGEAWVVGEMRVSGEARVVGEMRVSGTDRSPEY